MIERQVVFTPEAQDDLFAIYDWVAEKASPMVAMRFTGRIEGFCRRLGLMAERGRSRDDIRPGLRIIGFERRVTIAFVIQTERVVILRLFYGGRDWEEVLA